MIGKLRLCDTISVSAARTSKADRIFMPKKNMKLQILKRKFSESLGLKHWRWCDAYGEPSSNLG